MIAMLPAQSLEGDPPLGSNATALALVPPEGHASASGLDRSFARVMEKVASAPSRWGNETDKEGKTHLDVRSLTSAPTIAVPKAEEAKSPIKVETCKRVSEPPPPTGATNSL